jgi:shikimate dehydrogenase
MSRLSGATNVAGIIGWPVERSLSPAIHNAAFSALGLDWVYLPFPVEPGEAAHAAEAMRTLGIRGLNVTMPHKRTVIPALDELTMEAARIGAVNTITLDGERLIGSNTDGPGFLTFLDAEVSLDPKGARALILGAGGAARSVAVALGDAGAEVTIAARRPDQAKEIAGLVQGAIAVGSDPETLKRQIAGAGLIVNATPVGRDGEAMPLDPAGLGPGHVVVDLIYHPEATPLVRTAREHGARAFNGIGMLVHQAALSFEKWTGVAAPIDAMRAAVS